MSIVAVCKNMNKLRLFKTVNNLIFIERGRYLSQTHRLCSFYESDSRGAEYPAFPDKDFKEIFHISRKEFWGQCKLFYSELKDKFQQDTKLYNHGDTEVFWRFDSEVKVI